MGLHPEHKDRTQKRMTIYKGDESNLFSVGCLGIINQDR